MTLQQLTYLVTVADCGNITEAAEKLFISQPSLSAAIHNLEKEMGVTAFTRSNKGVTVTREGEELLSFARMLLEQADNMKEHFGNGERRTPKFSVSCQHYSFAVNAFVDLIKEYDAEQYSFIIRETQTGEIIEDVASGKSEIGVLYLSEHNDLQPYPYLVYEQGNNNSFYFSEEFISMLDFPKSIQVRDRATLFNLVIGLNGFTVSSGVIDQKLNGSSIIAKPLDVDKTMRIGIIKKKNIIFSRYASYYVEALRKHL